MAGDHKCPVCQATFTRPQHVARHMRSHTGDRPYKCQHCGDQFARSDLLSRHINKCHASERSSAANTINRRRGSASASRATTSKQACDQCVQESLPCDGSNPCTKCVQRKCRCTFVKFHRQTAPSGPGHRHPRPASASSSLSTSSRVSSHSHIEDFILAPPPPISVPSMASPEHFYVNTFAFNPTHTTSTDTSHRSLSMATDSDMVAKYRAQAELLHRNDNTTMLSNPQTTASVAPSLYAISPHSLASTNWYGRNEGPATSSQPGLMVDVPLDDHCMSIDEKDIQPIFFRNPPSDRDRQQFSLGPAAPPHQFQNDMFSGNLVGSSVHRARCNSLDFSDGSSSATSHSVPSSATSSNAHLPLGDGDRFHGTPNDHHQQQSRMILDQDHHKFPQNHPPISQQQQRMHAGGVSSAFGSMSIENHNVIAGISNDGAPFFSEMSSMQPHSPNATPMPIQPVGQSVHHGRDRSMSTPSTRDAEARELRDFWKAYMSTPFSGGGSGPTALDATMINQPGPSSGQRRRARVSSLPSVNTPIVEYTHARMGTGYAAVEEGISGGRSTLHGNTEDLRSYEAAINARNVGMQLNLVPKRKQCTKPSSNVSRPSSPSSESSSAL